MAQVQFLWISTHFYTSLILKRYNALRESDFNTFSEEGKHQASVRKKRGKEYCKIAHIPSMPIGYELIILRFLCIMSRLLSGTVMEKSGGIAKLLMDQLDLTNQEDHR